MGNLRRILAWPDLHPTYRETLGRRLADLWAMRLEQVPAFRTAYPALEQWRLAALADKVTAPALAKIAAIELTALIAEANGLESDATHARQRARDLATTTRRGRERGTA